MGMMKSLPARPLLFEEVEKLQESGLVSIAPVSMVLETGFVYSLVVSETDSDMNFGLVFNPEGEGWNRIGEADGVEALQDLMREIQEWVNKNYSDEHRMGDLDIDSGEVEWVEKPKLSED